MNKNDGISKNDNYTKNANKYDVEFSSEISEEQKNDLLNQSDYSNITDEQIKYLLANNN
ncbi:MAG: hypothetical protein ACREVX_00555 [Clostridium sp.]|uniref:hypothetical protein n=1 Tax=Clostridium sp. TaxID=1506 RepID=UPI003D6C9C0B